MLILFWRIVIARNGHGKNPLQKRVMTIQVAVIARHEAIQIQATRSGLLRVLRQAQQPPRNDGVTRFVIISAGHGKPLQKRVMTIQVAVIARHEAIQIESFVSGLLRASQ